MSAARRAHGGVAVHNGRLLVLCSGASDGCRLRRPTPLSASHPLARELAVFLTAVLVGSLGGLTAGIALGRWLQIGAAGKLALALGTTLTGATHARLVHRQSLRALVPRVLVAAPLAYAVMQGVHGLLAP